MAVKHITNDETHSSRMSIVQGKCPMGCGNTLFLGNGGYVTCSKDDCPDAEAATRMLEDGRPIATEHIAVLLRANQIHERRNAEYGDTWRSYGWRGSLVHLRTCAERAWCQWWDAKPTDEQKVDNLLDAINYAVFVIRNIQSSNRDGTWW